MNSEKNYNPQTARSYKTGLVDDNLSIHLNIKWLLQICAAIGAVVYGYLEITNRITDLERRIKIADTTITELVNKHIIEEQARYEEMEEELKWHQKLLKKKKK